MSDTSTRTERSKRLHLKFFTYSGKRRTGNCTGINYVDPRPVDRKVESALLAEALEDSRDNTPPPAVGEAPDTFGLLEFFGVFVFARDIAMAQRHYL
jgi:hypothetical protein